MHAAETLRPWRKRLRVDSIAASIAARPALAGSVALVLLAAFAYAPLLGGGMILTGDTLHAWRIFEIGRCLDDGQLPCRWAAELGNGYGLPLFNYYPPLPYYAGDLLHRLGFSYLGAVNVLYVLGLLGAGLAMFTLANRLWGPLGGLVSGVAYVYTPYLALDVYMRGALAEQWGLALAPALLWAVYELVTSSRARYLPFVALFTALLLLSHSLVALIVMPADEGELAGMDRVVHPEGTHWVDRCRGHTVVACRRGPLIYAAVAALSEDTLLGLMDRTQYEGD